MLRLPLVLLTVMSAGVVSGAAAQPSQPDSAVHRSCRDAHQYPVCGGYFLFELEATTRIGGSTVQRSGCVPSTAFDACSTDALVSYGAGDIGWMKNVSSRESRGVSLQIGGGEQGSRIALRGRERLWLSPRLAADFAAGPMTTQVIGVDGTHSVAGVAADAGLTIPRVGGAFVGVDLARESGQTVTASHAGVRFESRGAIIPGVLLVLGTLAVYLAFRDGGFD